MESADQHDQVQSHQQQDQVESTHESKGKKGTESKSAPTADDILKELTIPKVIYTTVLGTYFYLAY